jgi:PAS domain S-box-containing protein
MSGQVSGTDSTTQLRPDSTASLDPVYAAKEVVRSLQRWSSLQPPWLIGAAFVIGLLVSLELFHEIDRRQTAWAVLVTGLALTALATAYCLLARRRFVEVRVLVRRLCERVEERAVSEESYRLLVANAPDAIVTLDPAGRFTSINPFAETITGWSREEMLHRQLQPFIHPDDATKAAHVFESALAGDQPPTTEFRVLRKSGEALLMEFTVTPQFEANRVRGVLAIGRDISARRKAELARDGLEVQLRRAQKMEALGRMASGITHDFNNFLSIIIANCQLARLDLVHGHPAVQSVDEIDKASHRAAEMVRQILGFSRNQEQECVSLNLEPVVREALKLLRSMLPATVDIQAQLSRNCPSVLANAAQIHQVLLNLGTNAVHAMRENGGRLQISLESLEVDATLAGRYAELHAGPYVRLAVADSGHGMDVATLERIFDPFFTTKPPGEGTGLGLAVVHGIMQNHKGAITVYSELERGTRFNLYFPAVAREELPSEPLATTVPRGSGQHILFVDDDEALAEIGRRFLERLGYRATACRDSAAALKQLRTAPESCAAIISDLAMPGLSGLELADECRRVKPGLPFILMSGHNSVMTAESLKSCGVADFILKPFTFQALAEALHRVLPVPDNERP